MINLIIEWSLKNRVLVLALFLGAGVWGYWALVNTPIESWEFSARYEVEGRSDFLNHTAWLRARKAF